MAVSFFSFRPTPAVISLPLTMRARELAFGKVSDDTGHSAIAHEQVGAATHHHERDVFVEAQLDQVGEALFGLWLRPELRRSADAQSGMARKRLVEPNATGTHGAEQPVAQSQVGDEPAGGLVNISGAEAQNQIAILDFAPAL